MADINEKSMEILPKYAFCNSKKCLTNAKNSWEWHASVQKMPTICPLCLLRAPTVPDSDMSPVQDKKLSMCEMCCDFTKTSWKDHKARQEEGGSEN